ncbi:hypothetical protein [Thermovibrio sp.]
MEKRGKIFLAVLLFIGALISSYFALETYANHILKRKFDRRLEKLPFATSYSYFHYNLLKNDFEVKNFKIEKEPFTVKIGEIYVDLPFTVRKKEVPDYFSIELKRVEIPLNTPIVGDAFKFINYNKPYLTLNLSTGYEVKGKELEGKFDLTVKDLGEVKGKVEILGIDKELLEKVVENRLPPKVIERRGKLKELLLVYKDYGLFDKFLTFVSSQEGESKEKVKKELAKTVLNLIRSNKEVGDRIGTPLLLFIEEGKCLKLKIEPQRPIGLREIVKWAYERPNVEEILRKLNLRLENCS